MTERVLAVRVLSDMSRHRSLPVTGLRVDHKAIAGHEVPVGGAAEVHIASRTSVGSMSEIIANMALA